jgi:hypothetical protein
MKKLLALLFVVFSLVTFAQPTVNDLRTSIFDMETDSCSAVEFFESIKSETYNSALLQAYAGAMEAASAQCIKGAFAKLEYFSRGKKNLEAAIEKEPQNPEIRFLRFATQVNAPNFLEYDNTKEDVDFILEKLPVLLDDKTQKIFWNKAARAMLDSGKLSKKEKEKIESLL